MLVISPFCESDLKAALALHEWIVHLGSLQSHRVLLLASRGISDGQIQEVNDVAKQTFGSVSAIRQAGIDPKRWPQGPNSMFTTALEWVKKFHNGHWLWLESDMIPLAPGWLDQLEDDYKRRSMPFYGVIHDLPFKHLNGGAIYPINASALNPFILGTSGLPFDCIRPDLTLRHAYNSPLMQRMLSNPNRNEAMDFPSKESTSVIRPGVLLFHGCKNLSLIARLRERNGQLTPDAFGKPSIKSTFRRFFGTKPEPDKKTITIRRSGAIGDALAATCVANKLIERGHKVVFQCGHTVDKVLKYCSPHIKVAEDTGPCDLDLNGCYEAIPAAERAKQHFTEIFINTANKALRLNMNPWNCAPRLIVPARVTDPFANKFRGYPKPWIGIIPRSNSFLNRTVPNATWESAAKFIHGTCFWLGTNDSPNNFLDASCREITQVIAAIGNMDLVISVDSGPAHIAAAMKVPLLVIEQASSPDVHLPEQRDWQKISPANLTCLNCTQLACPIDADDPPCAHLDPMQIAAAANRRLLANGVSCAMPIYRPSAAMLNQSLMHVLPQVDEIVICVDQAGKIPEGALQHPKIRYTYSRLNDSGYGKKCMTAFRHTVNPFVLTLNDDCMLDPDAVKHLLDVMKSDEKCAVVGHMLFYPGRKKLQHGGPHRRPGKGDLGWGHLNDMPPKITSVTEVPFVTGASCLIRRSAFYDVDGFDGELKLYYEDAAFCLSVRKAGWKIFYTPFATAVHDEHSSTNPKMTPDVAEQVRISKEVFGRKWSKFFDHNDDKYLGTFDYEE